MKEEKERKREWGGMVRLGDSGGVEWGNLRGSRH